MDVVATVYYLTLTSWFLDCTCMDMWFTVKAKIKVAYIHAIDYTKFKVACKIN